MCFVCACADLIVRVPSGTIYVPASEHRLNFSSTLNFSVGKKILLILSHEEVVFAALSEYCVTHGSTPLSNTSNQTKPSWVNMPNIL